MFLGVREVCGVRKGLGRDENKEVGKLIEWKWYAYDRLLQSRSEAKMEEYKRVKLVMKVS